jgi:hypothetical protein
MERFFCVLKWFIGSSQQVSTTGDILSAITNSRALPSIDSNEIGLHVFPGVVISFIRLFQRYDLGISPLGG